MKVSDILRVKGGTLFTVAPDEPLSSALNVMSQHDIGSLVVMNGGELAGMLTFREVIQAVVDSQDFENRMLKAYIRDWPVDSRDEQPSSPAN